ncbi:hypothetical protein C1646_770911 [Rhizophagus diaphanus]|nr:hypothetical protein C1646_770911 [Rhizophagus diaphanus] [Rhizophagus sp. MUCL 43196]
MKSLIKYIKAKNIEKIFKELCEEFDSCINSLPFSMINVNIDDELRQLKADQVDLFKYLQEMAADIATGIKVIEITTNLNSLKLSDYKQDDNEKSRKDGRVTKCISVKNGGDEFAFKRILKSENLKVIRNQVTILKKLHEWENIIKFYRFDLRLKLRMSPDIVRGLNFLRTIMHRDIRAKNVLITINETAKLTNIRSSRNHLLVNKLLGIENPVVERARYRAPESMGTAPGYNQMPEEFKQLQFEAVHQDPDFRPKITKMFEVLRNCVKRSKQAFNIDQDAYALPINSPDFESFKYMTLADAAKQHKMYKNGKPVGDVKTAYKCFEEYANNPNTTKRNRITANYYKAVYILKGLVEGPPNKDKIVAEIVKEVADDEANEHPEAKVWYGNCLFNSKVVEKNESEALKYFEQAAEDDIKVAMYNVGKMYYNGYGCTKDIEKLKLYRISCL